MIEHEDRIDSNDHELRAETEVRIRAREAAGDHVPHQSTQEPPPAAKSAVAKRRYNVIMAGVLAMTALSFSKDPEPWVWWTCNIFGLCCLVYVLLDKFSDDQD